MPKRRNIFVAGDQCVLVDSVTGRPLPGVAPVAAQQGRFIADAISRDVRGKPRGEFRYRDKGQMATIGRSRAITEIGKRQFTGLPAWLLWLFVHIYFLTGFRNRLLVVINWAWPFFAFRRGARLIVGKQWRSYERDPQNDFAESSPDRHF